jgi:hypothetical protein
MSDSTPAVENPLESAITQLREICSDGDLLKPSIDAGSVGRMLVHLENINTSVLASTQDHVNAAKRLNDFALTLARIAKNSDLPNEMLTARMAIVAANLRAASEVLARGDDIPNWRAPAASSREAELR